VKKRKTKKAARPVRGAELIANERLRQLARWSANHDAEHERGELAIVAAILALHGTNACVTGETRGMKVAHQRDAWGLVAKHGHDWVRLLTIAGALIAAEIDRVRRLRGVRGIEG